MRMDHHASTALPYCNHSWVNTSNILDASEAWATGEGAAPEPGGHDERLRLSRVDATRICGAARCHHGPAGARSERTPLIAWCTSLCSPADPATSGRSIRRSCSSGDSLVLMVSGLTSGITIQSHAAVVENWLALSISPPSRALRAMASMAAGSRMSPLLTELTTSSTAFLHRFVNQCKQQHCLATRGAVQAVGDAVLAVTPSGYSDYVGGCGAAGYRLETP